MSDVNDQGFYNRSLERALQILNAFSYEKQALTLTELSEILKLSMATISRLCSTLIKFDFLKYDQNSKQYFLGLKLFELGGIIFSSFSIRGTATPHIIRLQSKLGKTMFLGILQNNELIYIDKRDDPRNPIIFASRIGTRRPPHFGMLGQLLMAYLSDSEVDQLLTQSPLIPFTKKSITDVKEFKQRLLNTRKQGFFVDEESAFDGITGVAAPIRNFTGAVVAAIGIGFISSSVTGDELKQIINDMIETAKEISRELGWKNKEDL